jgi:hypothetical protein
MTGNSLTENRVLLELVTDGGNRFLARSIKTLSVNKICFIRIFFCTCLHLAPLRWRSYAKNPILGSIRCLLGKVGVVAKSVN